MSCLMGCGFHGSGELGLCSACERTYRALPADERPDLGKAKLEVQAKAAEADVAAAKERQERVASIDRFVEASGTAFERGKHVATAMRDRILGMHEAAPAVFPTGGDVEKWDAVAEAGLTAAREWTPTAVAEMEGMASAGDGLSLTVISRHACTRWCASRNQPQLGPKHGQGCKMVGYTLAQAPAYRKAGQPGTPMHTYQRVSPAALQTSARPSQCMQAEVF